jgi:hypothetical protein
MWFSVAMVLLLCVAARAAAQDQWDRANAATRRLPPSEFTELPAIVLEGLEARGCRIPQTYWDNKRHNVIKGQFIEPGQFDWAVLCSRNDTSRILIFRSGLADTPDALREVLDRNYLQSIGNGQIGFSRFLAVVDSTYIQKHAERHPGSSLPPLDHEGINDVFLEKGSLVWYWYGGRWLQLPGAD